MTAIIFLVVLVALILVHEWGHYFAAKRVGMRVDEFGIGFPPKVLSRQWGETEYSLNALPIGGFVRIFGEDLDAVKEEADWPRAFGARPKWAQAVVLIAGVVMNVIFAWMLFAAAFMIGLPTQVDEATATDAAVLTVTNVLPDSPAAAAGITPGAQIVSVESTDSALSVITPSTFSAFVQEHAEGGVTLTYELADETRTTTLAPQTGVIEGESQRPAVGLALTLLETTTQPVHIALYDAAVLTTTSLRDITVGLFTLVRDAVVGQADLESVTGPVGIYGLVGQAADFGLTSLLMFTAIISLNLAIINLLPVPALDGGRLVMVAIEAIKGSPVPADWAIRVNTVGFILLLGLMLLVTVNDIQNLL